jgi:hypothetical protein
VILEKNDRIFNRIDYSGNPVPSSPSNDYFYGDWRQITKVRWLQRAYWRYLQARWGYSTSIHSWELLNEGDPFNSRHYTLADELGKYMHQFAPNKHMVSTSNWHSFPKSAFWANSNYPDVDFADVHQYVPKDAAYSIRIDSSNYALGTAADYAETTMATYNLSSLVGAQKPQGAGKPVIRGETGFVLTGSEPSDPQILSDQEGIWLHNFIWGGINSGGLIESYWYEQEHIYRRQDGIDLRYQFKSYFDFVKNIPLNSGNYEDAAASPSHPKLRVWGQKDRANGRAHLWIQNTDHHWRNAVAGVTPAPVTGSVSIAGFAPNASYSIEWWNTDSGSASASGNIVSDGGGNLNLNVTNLVSDIAVRIGNYSDPSARPAPPGNLRIVR